MLSCCDNVTAMICMGSIVSCINAHIQPSSRIDFESYCDFVECSGDIPNKNLLTKITVDCRTDRAKSIVP